MKLDHLVVRSSCIHDSKNFYRDVLGIEFTLEKHGKGPEHFASTNLDFVLELYPAGGPMTMRTTSGLRLGFTLPYDKVVEAVGKASLRKGKCVSFKVAEPTNHATATLNDPDGIVIALESIPLPQEQQNAKEEQYDEEKLEHQEPVYPISESQGEPLSDPPFWPKKETDPEG